ncbi:MarR family transcriptional regulator [Pseudoflavonifractor sp. 524-17]|uniref:MarR family winged helix-turn-helix transcriptional regulator n=1 Tax=Pseudoflavonifractor sp. 524-17 TaxID=2304577 RepID=UPI00137B4C02|nr:MarR family transcriptional regulator [Pseudoflavonifractor sp. 524-17]NCE63124.1 MarR family transcriptional regulator [Pseudoflavonifractor sp. 524-17]
MPSDFWDHLALARRLYCQAVEPVAQRCGLTRAELDILLFLANNPSYDTAADIICRRGLAKSHVSTSVHTLEARGWLSRNFRGGNRKSIHLTLTPLAAAAVEEGRRAQARFFQGLTQGLHPEQLAIMERCFAQVGENLRRLSSGTDTFKGESTEK